MQEVGSHTYGIAAQIHMRLLLFLQAMTEFHYLLLDPRTLRIYNRISGQAVQELAISGAGGVLPSPQGTFSMLLRDAEAAQTYLMAGDTSLPTTIRGQGGGSLKACRPAIHAGTWLLSPH